MKRLSRLDALKPGVEPDLPQVDPALMFLVGYLFDAGPVSAAGMGNVPLTWESLESWQRAMGIELEPWQARLLRELSGEYLKESQSATEHDAPPPWLRQTTAEHRERIAKHIRNVFRG